MNAIELINFIKQQPLISHAVPVLVDGKPIVKVELIEDSECGYAFNLLIYEHNKCKIEKGRIKSLFSPRRAGIHKWMKNQMNRFMRRKPIEDDEVGGKSNRKPIKGWEF